MIKTFEQFIAEHYCKPVGNPVNEAYQSSKLREIINQHGKPKRESDYKMLYDIKDDEIIDVLDSKEEYYEKYSNKPESPLNKEEATFILELADGACVVISNLGVLKSYFDKDFEGDMKKELKKRHSERHVGNLGKYGELDIRKKHRENVEALEKKRLIEKLQPSIQEIVDYVNSTMDGIDISDLENNDGEIESEITLENEEYTIYISYTTNSSEPVKKYGAEYYNVYYNVSRFEIASEDDIIIDNEELGISKETHEELFKTYTIKDVEGYIYDQYEYYGVSPSDFF